MTIVWRLVLFASLLGNGILVVALMGRAGKASDLSSHTASLDVANAFLLDLTNASIDGNCTLRRDRVAQVARKHKYEVDWDARYANVGPFMARSSDDCLTRIDLVGF